MDDGQVAAPALASSPTLRCAWRIWLTTAASIATVAGFAAVCAQGAAQRWLPLTFPARSGLGDLVVVLAHNVPLTAGILVAALGPSRSSDLVLSGIWLANTAVAGIALGGYGWQLVCHAGVYATTELAAWSVAASVYVNSRTGIAAPTFRAAGWAAALVVASAVIETILPVRL